MKVAFVELCGFRGYRKSVRLEFGERFTIIDGRNGVGKSTIFDAIEYALTGQLTKYGNDKADRESVEDYLWWKGGDFSLDEAFVEVGFRDANADPILRVRRTPLSPPPQDQLMALESRLCDPALSPAAPLRQLCASSIIRDELIASLSLDMKETERYALLREALGANDADKWIARGATLVDLAKKHRLECEQEIASANANLAGAVRRLDEIRGSMIADTVLAEAVKRLQAFSKSSDAPHDLVGTVRSRIAAVRGRIDLIERVLKEWMPLQERQQRQALMQQTIDDAIVQKAAAEARLTALSSRLAGHSSLGALAQQASDLVGLVILGKKLGLHEDKCPLCASSRSKTEYIQAIADAEARAQQLNEQAAQVRRDEEERKQAELKVRQASDALMQAQAARDTWEKAIGEFDRLRKDAGLDDNASPDQVQQLLQELPRRLAQAENDLRVLETISLNQSFERAQRALEEAKTRVAQAQEKFGRARRVEEDCRALHDAARRAAGEPLSLRLERVLPLMTELYRRLRPHPIWGELEYAVRGDVRRFLKLQVGNDLNPQFMFSSGQRRATGLAFLLAVNLSLAWSRWKSILLDDPVQHIDDFRSVHLAEVLAQLVADGRQIICAVEDAALADMLCRRLPVGRGEEAKRITLGPDMEGASVMQAERYLQPHSVKAFLGDDDMAATA